MEGGNDAKSAITGASDSKFSYSQALQKTKLKTFYRKISYTIGVVETIHVTHQNARRSHYARVTVGKGEELSLKLPDDQRPRPGDHVRVTQVYSDGKITPSLYGIHSGPVPPDAAPLCRGRVKWFDKNLRSWTVKVRSSRKYLRLKKQEKQIKIMRDQTIFFVPLFHDGQIQIGKVVEVEGGIPEGTPVSWTLSTPLTARLLLKFPKIAMVRPTTRSDHARVPQLDLKKAEDALPPGSSPLHSLPYLQLEELLIRQKFPSPSVNRPAIP